MRPIIIVLISFFLASCGTYKGNELWKRNSCERLVDADERDRCLEDAMQPEKEYKEKLEEAMEG